jgi:hypothetical protein
MATEQELQKAVFGGESSMGALEALAGGLKEGMKAFTEGVGNAFDAAQSSPVLNDMANHGRSELAAALFNGSPYVMYQKGSHDQPQMGEKELAAAAFGGQDVSPAMNVTPNAPTMESPQMDQQIKQGGMGM